MLKLGAIDDRYCQGVSFDIASEDALAKAIALILIQEYALARDIVARNMSEEAAEEIAVDADDIEDIISRRLKPAMDYHRDGFLFQLMMWLAAHLDLRDGDLVALPHAQASAKGQDSIVVHRAEEAVFALSICEDKATEHPRETVRDEVWPEIEDYERGGRRDELRSNIIATLGLGGIPVDAATDLVRRISWEGKRRYRVRVSLEKKRTTTLFAGFQDVAPGNVERRRGETVHIPGLRAWMTQFAGKVEAELRSYIREE